MQLLKEQGITEAHVFPTQPVEKPTIPGLPPVTMDLLILRGVIFAHHNGHTEKQTVQVQLARPRYGASRNPLGAVIERLERGVVVGSSLEF